MILGLENRWVPEEKTISIVVNDCEKIPDTKCHPVEIPEYKVINEAKTDRVTVQLPACKHQVVKDRWVA